MRSILPFCLAALGCCALTPIKSSDFPSVAQRAPYFEERVNAATADVRKGVLTEITYFFDVPDREYVAFLKRMILDPDPVIRGQAVKKLHAMWAAPDPKELPDTFAGYYDQSLVDLTDELTIPYLLKDCQSGTLRAGYAAYALGLLRYAQAIPDLRNLGAHPNIFVRYTAARALIDCGVPGEAVPILRSIITAQSRVCAEKPVSGYSDKNTYSVTVRQPWYAANACFALAMAGEAERKEGLEALVRLLGCLEQSANANDQSKLPYVRQLLAILTGSYFLSYSQAARWFRETGGNVPVEKVVSPGGGSDVIGTLQIRKEAPTNPLPYQEADRLAREYAARMRRNWGEPEKVETVVDGSYRFYYRTGDVERKVLGQRVIVVRPDGTVSVPDKQ